MSSEKYAYIREQRIREQRACKEEKEKIKKILKDFETDYLDSLKICQSSDLEKTVNKFSDINVSINSKINSDSLSSYVLNIIKNNLFNSLSPLYSEVRREISNAFSKSIKILEGKINKSKSQIEPRKFNKIIGDVNKLSNSILNILYSNEIKKGIEIINLEISNLYNDLAKAIQYKEKLKKDIEKIQNQNQGLFKEIEKFAKIQSNSGKIESLKLEIYHQSEEVITQQFSAPNLENVLQFEQKRNRLLGIFHQQIDRAVQKGEGLDYIDFKSKIHSLKEVLNEIEKHCLKKPIKSNEKEKLIDEIYQHKEKVIAMGIPEYQVKVKNLNKELEIESQGRLEMIKEQIKLWLIEGKNKIMETASLKERLFPLKLRVSHSMMPDAKHVELIIDELFVKPLITKDEVEVIEEKIKQLQEKEEQIRSIVEELTNIEEVTRIMKEAFVELGYSPITEINVNAKPIYIDTPWIDYKVKLTCNRRGEIIFRFIRVVSSENEKDNITKLQKQKDIDICKKWSNDYTKWLERLDEMGIPIKENWRKEPEDIGIKIEVNKEFAAKAHKERQKRFRKEYKKHSRNIGL